ncbi:MAG: F0F1 ATP synthase subunit B [Nitrospirota bacterium]|jgi:F-type H+-transporting ATPase subunit b
MLVDWFTTAAQIVNFLVLMYLLKRFLYGPVIRAMDAREEKIASRLEEAGRKKAEAESEAEDYRKKGREIEARREGLVEKAREEAESTRKELAEKARREVDELRDNWLRALEQGKRAFLEDLRTRTTEHVYETARKALADLSTAELEEHMADVFVGRLKELGSGALKEIRESLEKAGARVVVSSAFELPPGKRQHITREIHSSIKDGVDVEYETEPGLLAGLELKTPGQVVAWNLGEYLKALEEEVSEIISEETEKAGK